MTSRVIILSDLRAEIGARKTLDLESVSGRDKVDRSFDLRQALSTKRLRIVKQTVRKKPKSRDHHHHYTTKVIEKIVEIPSAPVPQAPTLDEEKIALLIKGLLDKQKSTQAAQDPEQLDQIADMIGSLKSQIDSLKLNQGASEDDSFLDPSIDGEKIAAIQREAVDKMFKEIETESTRKPRKVAIVNRKNLSDLADELD